MRAFVNRFGINDMIIVKDEGETCPGRSIYFIYQVPSESIRLAVPGGIEAHPTPLHQYFLLSFAKLAAR